MMKNHQSFVHQNEKTLKFEICQKYFECKVDLNGHQRTVEGNEKPYKCDICPKSFGGKSKAYI